MPIRLPYLPVSLTAAVSPVLHSYWGAGGFSRPLFSAQLYNPVLNVYRNVDRVQIDLGSDWCVFPSMVAHLLGLRPPFRRVVPFSGASGQGTFSLPDDGTVGLMATDFREYYYLPRSPIGFWTTPGGPAVLGLTGFLQHFEMHIHNDGVHRPEVELSHTPTFPGRHGRFSAAQPFLDFLRAVHAAA
jgi:hypothetical protein